MTTVLHLDAVTRRYRTSAATVVAVDGVTLSVEGGEVVALIGPSGSGKTTAINLALGWEVPDDGVVRRPAGGGWGIASVIPQELGLLPELTAIENVRLVERLGAPAHTQLSELCGALELDGLVDRFPEELSMGEQQRVAVARAVAPRPRLLVADEPTAHQDEARADLVMAQLADVAAAGGGVLVATHDTRLLEHVDRVVELLDGRVVSS